MSESKETLAVRGGLVRTGFDETAEALFLTSGYVYGSAAEAEAAFAGERDRFIYSRYGNPTVGMFEERMRLLEGAEAAWATSSGMSAVFNALMALVEAGDRVVASRELFGSCFVILDELLPRWGVRTEFVTGSDLGEWERALSAPAKAVFLESPSNPMQDIVDIRAVSALAHEAGATVVVDNVFATPVLQHPLALGADVTVYSATKHIDGQGRTLGGIILGSEEYASERLQPLMRHTGPTLSPFNAWVLLKGLETMSLRVRHQSEAALFIARELEQHPQVRSVRYPYLDSHPQHALAMAQMSAGGTVVTFEVEGGRLEAFGVLDRLEMIDISNNLGDAKSLATHPASTTHRRLDPEVRQEMGISEGVIRVSVGLEDRGDILADLGQALHAR
ncbi:MAG TPA: O-succinylhomoserine sulfhydrylase [Acidimicrobiia bacterium]